MKQFFLCRFVLYFIGAVSIYLIIKPNPKSNKIIGIILSFLWLWMGIVYHIIFFTTINKAAYVFGGLFIIQGILFLVFRFLKNNLSFNFTKVGYGITGIILILFALVVYPLLGYFFGHIYPYPPTFGLPCPTTIFTFGFSLFHLYGR